MQPTNKPTASRVAQHARPPAANSKAMVPSLTDQLSAMHEALVAYGDRLDYLVDKNRRHPAVAQKQRHAAKHGLQTFAALLKQQGVDVCKALPPEWVTAVEQNTTEPQPTHPPEHTAP